MKRALLLFSLALAAHAATATFTYTYGSAACPTATPTPAGAPKSCISGFAVGTVSAGVFTPMATCPLSSVTTGTVTGITCTFSGTAPLGPVTFAVVATYFDAAGNPGQSPLVPVGTAGSNETAVTVTPSSPAGVVIIFP